MKLSRYWAAILTVVLFAVFCPEAHSQATVTPNIGLQLPSYQQTNWQVPITWDLNALDAILGGAPTLPTGTTPTISKSGTWVTANTTATTITNFIGGFPGQTIRLVCAVSDTFTTVATSANINLPQSFTCGGTNLSLTLTLTGTTWTEVARGSISSGGTGCTVAGNPGDVQAKSPSSTCEAAPININSEFSVVNMNENTAFVGPRPYFDITNPVFGAVGDGGILNTQAGSITSGTNTFTVSTTPVTGWHTGMGISINGAGASGASLVAKVGTITGDIFTLVDNTGAAVNAGTTVSGAGFKDDDTLAIQAAIAAACATPTLSGGAAVFSPPGTFAFTVAQNTTAATFTGCQDLYIYGGNASEHNGGQFTRPPSSIWLANAGSIPGSGPTLDESYPDNEVTVKDMTITGYNTAFYSRGASDVTLDNDTFSVTNTGLSGNAAVHLSNLYWARILGGSLQTNNGSRPYPPGLLLSGDACAGCTATVINFRMQDTRMVGGNIQYVQTTPLNASQPGYWEIDNADTESQDSDYLSITNSSGSAFTFGPIRISRASVSDAASTTAAIINFHGAATTDTLSGVRIDQSTPADSNFSNAALIVTEGTLSGYEATGCGTGIACSTLAENASGSIIGTGFVTNAQGEDFFANTSDAFRLTTNPFWSAGAADGPSIRVTQTANQLASYGLDGKNGLMFSDGQSQGWLSDLQASSAGNIDVAFPQNYPPTSLAGTPSATGGTLGAGTYYVYAASDTIAGDNCNTQSSLSAISNIAGPFVLTGSTSSIAMTWTAAASGLTPINGYCLLITGETVENKFASRINTDGFVSGAGTTSVTITTTAATTGVFPVSQMQPAEHFTPSGITTPSVNGVVYVDGTVYACSSAGINAAISALPATGGVVDSTGCQGTVSLTSPIIVGSSTEPVTWRFDRLTNYDINVTGGVDAIQLWEKSAMIGWGSPNANNCTFCETATTNVSSVIASYPRTNQSIVGMSNFTVEGNASATTTNGLLDLQNITDLSTISNLVIWNTCNTVGLYMHTTSAQAMGPVNLDNLSVNGNGCTGAKPVLIKSVTGSGVTGTINFNGGSFTHPGSGGLAIVDLEGITGGDNSGVNFYGSQFESSNTGDIGILINNSTAVYGSGLIFTSATNPGAAAIKITGANSGQISFDNIDNFNSWTDTIDNESASPAITIPASTQARIGSYRYGYSGQTDTYRWDDAAGNIAQVDTNGLLARKINEAALTASGGIQDFSAASVFRPKFGTVAGLPGTCTVGDIYEATDATAGQNWYFCTATNTWTQQLNSGGSGLPTLPTSPNGVPQTIISTPSGGVGGAATWSLGGVAPNPQTGTTYTIAVTDRASYVSFSNASAVAVTLPQAGSTGFGSNFVFSTCDIGAGTATITPTTSTISYSNGSSYTSGATSLVLTTGQCATIYSDNTNYFAIVRGNPIAFSTLTDGATITWAIASAPYANANVTIAGNRTLDLTGLVNGGQYTVFVKQDATGTRTLTPGTGCTWLVLGGTGSGIFPLSTAANALDAISFTYDGTDCKATVGKEYAAP